MPGVPVEQQLLAHCYAAEALCNLQSSDQAAAQLQRAVALQATCGTDPVQPAGKPSGDAGTMADPQVGMEASV